MKQPRDITGDIGPLFPLPGETKYPMYSFRRPAFDFWQGFYEGLIANGFTHEQALTEMQSSNVRHWLDSEEDKIVSLGRKMAEGYST